MAPDIYHGITFLMKGFCEKTFEAEARVVGADENCFHRRHTRLKRRLAFCPPNAKLLERAYSMSLATALLGV